MNIYKSEIEGREFDWFALDSEENVGLFSTAGEGVMPNRVIENYVQHDGISELIDSPNFGSSEVWSDYAALGLYVYDWSLLDRLYVRERVPTSKMQSGLKAKIMSIDKLPKLPIKFTQLTKIDKSQLSVYQ